MSRHHVILTAIGILIFAMGAGAALLAEQLTTVHPPLTTNGGATMTGECLTCHSDIFRAAERVVQPMPILNAHQTATAPVQGGKVDGLSVVPMVGDTRPYLVTDAAPRHTGAPSLRYRMRTDDGVLVLPETWNLLGQALSAVGAAATPLCEACHFPTPTAPAAGV